MAFDSIIKSSSYISNQQHRLVRHSTFCQKGHLRSIDDPYFRLSDVCLSDSSLPPVLSAASASERLSEANAPNDRPAEFLLFELKQ